MVKLRNQISVRIRPTKQQCCTRNSYKIRGEIITSLIECFSAPLASSTQTNQTMRLLIADVF